MSTVLLKINTTDVSNNIIKDSYAVNRESVYKEYEDANGAIHRRHIRYKIKGKFKMYFPTLTTYSTFKTLIDTNKSATNYTVPCTVYDNLSGTAYTINAFIDYKPTLARNGGVTEHLDKFDVTIEEQ